MNIRNAGIEDAEEICALANALERHMESLGDPAELQFSADSYRRDGFGDEPRFRGLVAEFDGEIKGYLLNHFGYDVDRAKRIMHVIHLYVRPADRRTGIGRALMEKAAEICKEAGGIGLRWEVFPTNKDALKFYEKLGAINTQDVTYQCIYSWCK